MERIGKLARQLIRQGIEQRGDVDGLNTDTRLRAEISGDRTRAREDRTVLPPMPSEEVAPAIRLVIVNFDMPSARSRKGRPDPALGRPKLMVVGRMDHAATLTSEIERFLPGKYRMAPRSTS